MNKDDVSKLVHLILDSEIERLRKDTVSGVSYSSREEFDEWRGSLARVACRCAMAPYSRDSVDSSLSYLRAAYEEKVLSSEISFSVKQLLGDTGEDLLELPNDPSVSLRGRPVIAGQGEGRGKVLELAQAVLKARVIAYSAACDDPNFSETMKEKAHKDLDDFHLRPVDQQVSKSDMGHRVNDALPVQPLTDVGPPTLTIEDAIMAHLGEMVGKGKSKTASERASRLRLFIESIDASAPLSELTAGVLLDFNELLAFIPARHHDKYPNVSALEFRTRAKELAIPATELLGYKTKINILTMLRAFINWLPKRGHISFDHGRSLSLTISESMRVFYKEYKKRGGSSRTSFSLEELSKLFTWERYLAETSKRPERFWLPILALYTGGRTQDLLTLRRSDIKITPDNPDIYHRKHGSFDEDTSRDGIPYIDLTDTMEKELKTERSNRVIPIHPFVWDDLGFGQYIQAFAKDEFLFGNHVMVNGELSNSFGAWFTRFRRSAGVGRQAGEKMGRDVTFHSLRHTVKRALRIKRCDPSIVHEVIGHDDNAETSTSKTYSGDFLIEQKLDGVIAELDFHKAVPLQSLSVSKWTTTTRQKVRRRKVASA